MQELLKKWQTWIAVIVGLLTIAGMIFDLPGKIRKGCQREESPNKVDNTKLESTIQQDGLPLYGRVWDENKEPLAGVNVRLGELGLTDTTNQDGEFKFRVKEAKPRLVNLIAKKDGYVTVDMTR